MSQSDVPESLAGIDATDSSESVVNVTPGPPISQLASELMQEAQEQDREIAEASHVNGVSRTTSLLPSLDTNLLQDVLAQNEHMDVVTPTQPPISPLSPVPVYVAEPSNIPLLLDSSINPTHQQVEDINKDTLTLQAQEQYPPNGEEQLDVIQGTPLASGLEAHEQDDTGEIQETDRDDISMNDDAVNQQLYASLQQETQANEGQGEQTDVLMTTENSEEQNQEPISNHTVIGSENILSTNGDTTSHQISAVPGIHTHLSENLKSEMLTQHEHVESNNKPSSDLALATAPSSLPKKVETKPSVLNTKLKPGRDAPSSPVSHVPPPVPAFAFSQASSLPAPPHLVNRTAVHGGVQTSPTTLQHPPPHLRHPLPVVPTASAVEDHDEEPKPFTVEEEKDYEAFQAIERDYVSKGQWDRFPNGSRLFIGNLPTEKVTKRDLYRIFSKFGRIAQVSIKQAYGFIQFFDASACTAALAREQGASVRGRKMHLEVSKPQRNTRPSIDNSNRNRRSRSPDPVPMSPRGGRTGSNFRGSHYTPNSPGNERDLDRRDSMRSRDEYRGSGRRTSSPRYGRDEHRRDHYDRSRSPVNRYRSPTPPRPAGVEDELPLPKRASHEVPEVQVIIFSELDRNFIRYIEKTFKDRNLRVDVLFLAPRLSLEAVIKRQIIEGVQAVIFLTERSQAENRISMQIFDRRGGTARYDEYEGIEPSIGVELVLRAKQTQAPVPMASYGHIPYSNPPPQQQTQQPPMANLTTALTGAAGNPNIASLISSLDPASLQKLLAQLQNQQQQQPPPAPTYHSGYGLPQPQTQPDLHALLSAGLNARPVQGQHAPQPSPQVYGLPGYAQAPPTLGGYYANGASQQQNPQVKNIMDQLTGQWPGRR